MEGKSIRLTGTSYAVLGLLEWCGGATPYELKQVLEKSIENFWPVPHTTFYAEPERLAKGGYLSVQQEQGGRRRKLYSLTDKGRQALREWASEPEVGPPQLRDEGMLKTFLGGDPQPILDQRRRWHEAKLAELEGYLANLRAAGGPRRVELTLMAGTAYHRRLLEIVDELGAL